MGMLNDKICVITGGAGSIGRACAALFRAEGATLVLADRNAGALADLADDAVLTLGCDVSSEDDVAALAEAVRTRFGRVDVVLSNAGNFGRVAPIADYPTEIFTSVFDVHVKGTFLLAKHLTPMMATGASFVITSSVAGVRGDPGVYGYITAKHAQVGLMRCLAKELASRGIRVNTIHPGPLDNGFQHAVERRLGAEMGRDGTEFFNELIPMGRHGSPEEIARSVLYLASDMAAFTTGTTLMVDGGMSA